MNIRDLCYSYFGWLGGALSKIFKGTEQDLDSANMKVHPEVYFSFVGTTAFISLMISVTVLSFRYMGLVPWLSFIPMSSFILLPFVVLTPLLVIVIGIVIPKMGSSNRISGLKVEIPYASMYISTMTSGGLSPYESILRLSHMDLLPNMQEEVKRIEVIVMSTGTDPITAMEQAAKVVNINQYKELLLGYASTVRTGGDTLHYLFNQTDSMFRSISIKIKGLGESMSMLMEAYTVIGILGVLGLFLIFVVGMAMPTMGVGMSSFQFFIFSFIALPMISVVFIYACDAIQLSYPVSNWKTYIVFAIFVPIGILFATQTVIACYTRQLLIFPQIYQLLLTLRDMVGLAQGTEAALGLSVTLIIIALPCLIADSYFIGREGSILSGINQFLRDLVETRKSGLSPENCIHALADRDYRGFSKHLKKISMKLNWGYPLHQIYKEFRETVLSWLALVNVYLLIDTIEVGGGTEESLETLARFSESTKDLDDEKRAILMPLTIVPYIGAALLTGTTVMFLQFFTGMSGVGISVATVELYKTLLTPLSLHSFILGLVTGKIVSGRVSAGFKHAILLTLVSLGGIWAVSHVSLGGGMV